MRIEQLEYILEISNSKSLNSACAKLHISVQALSYSIKCLETELGVRLLNRSKQGVSLTEAGKKTADIAETIVGEWKGLMKNFEETGESDAVQGELPVLATAEIGVSALPEIISRLYHSAPRLKLAVEYDNTENVLTRIENESKDENRIGLVILSEIEGKKFYNIPDNLCFAPFESNRPYICVNQHHPLAGYKSLSISAILRYPIVLVAKNEEIQHHGLTKVCNHFGKPNFISVDSPLVFDQMILRNNNIVGLTDKHRAWDKEFVYISISDKVKASFGYVLNKAYPIDNRTEKFIDCLAMYSQAHAQRKQVQKHGDGLR